MNGKFPNVRCGSQGYVLRAICTPTDIVAVLVNMAKLAAGLLVVALVGMTSLALACDLQCRLEDSGAASAAGSCHSHGSHPTAPKHSVHTRAVVKALSALSVPDAACRALSEIIKLQQGMTAPTSEPYSPVPAVFVLRI